MDHADLASMHGHMDIILLCCHIYEFPWEFMDVAVLKAGIRFAMPDRCCLFRFGISIIIIIIEDNILILLLLYISCAGF